VAQWMLNKHNKNATSFFGSVGKDAHGKKLKECAEKDGVNVHYLEHDDVATGTCAVCVVESERSLVANLSAANKFHHDHLEDEKSKVGLSIFFVLCNRFSNFIFFFCVEVYNRKG
jgi:adenosine kinase